jgi:hypothetical protein
MENQIIEILKIVMGLCAPVLVAFAYKIGVKLVAYVSAKLGAVRTSSFEAFALKVVKTLAQKYATATNAEKFAKAVEAIELKYGKDFFSAQGIEILIESAYADLKLAEGQIISKGIATPIEEVKAEVLVAPVIPEVKAEPVVEAVVTPTEVSK